MKPSEPRLEPISPGAQLAAARVRAGLSLDEVSRRSRVPKPALEALERDDWAGMSAPIYARGFARLYAAEVGLDPAVVTALVDEGRAHRRQQDVDVSDSRIRAQRRARWGSLRAQAAVVVAVGALILVVLSFVFGGSARLEADAGEAGRAAAHP